MLYFNELLYLMKKHSCGAILYTIHEDSVYIVLGMEKSEWYPFKGVREIGESSKDAAIREVCEETCGVISPVELESLTLCCNYSTKRKHYHIGLAYMPFEGISKFYQNRSRMLHENDPSKWMYLEKTHLSMFNINKLNAYKFHEITSIPIKFYYNQLKKMQQTLRVVGIPRRIYSNTSKTIPAKLDNKSNLYIHPNRRPISYLLNVNT